MHQPSAAETSLRDAALAEFDAMVAALRGQNIEVMVWDDTPPAPLPDAVFPNNWLTTWDDGTLFLYPMEPKTRRAERQPALIRALQPAKVVDLSPNEAEHRFLEGTGAMVFDHDNRIAYGALSPRCDRRLFEAHAGQLGYQAVTFRTRHNGMPVYHTNVMLAILSQAAIICSEVITSHTERRAVLGSLHQIGHQIIEISAAQLGHFCANVLPVANRQGQTFLVLSQTALDALTPVQRKIFGTYARLLPVVIPTIERVGGGSARCLLAEMCF